MSLRILADYLDNQGHWDETPEQDVSDPAVRRRLLDEVEHLQAVVRTPLRPIALASHVRGELSWYVAPLIPKADHRLDILEIASTLLSKGILTEPFPFPEWARHLEVVQELPEARLMRAIKLDLAMYIGQRMSGLLLPLMEHTERAPAEELERLLALGRLPDAEDLRPRLGRVLRAHSPEVALEEALRTPDPLYCEFLLNHCGPLCYELVNHRFPGHLNFRPRGAPIPPELAERVRASTVHHYLYPPRDD